MKKIFVNPNIEEAETLPAVFYRSNSYFEELKEKVFVKSWQFVGHDSILPININTYPFEFIKNYIEEGKITLKKYFHIGIAVDTPNGLMVPKIRNADIKNIAQLGDELKKVSNDCRELKINKKEFFGGSMTITSLGGIGGSFFTPIINLPEVAILGIGRSYKKQIYINNKFMTRTVLPLSLSYDHRIIDGAEAARFNNEMKDNLGKNFAYKLAI